MWYLQYRLQYHLSITLSLSNFKKKKRERETSKVFYIVIQVCLYQISFSTLLPHLHNSLLWEQNDPRLAIRALPRTKPFSSPLLTTVFCFVILLCCMLSSLICRYGYCYYSYDFPETLAFSRLLVVNKGPIFPELIIVIVSKLWVD